MKPPHRATESGGGAEHRRLLSLAHGFPTRTLETDHEQVPAGTITSPAIALGGRGTLRYARH